MRNLLILLIIAPLMCSAVSLAGTITPRLQQTISGANSTNTTFPVIIRFQTQLNTNAFSNANSALNQSARRSKHIKSLKSLSESSVRQFKSLLPTKQLMKSLWAINGLATELSKSQIYAIAALPMIYTLDLDIEIELFAANTAVPAAAANWNLNIISVPSIWSYGYTGDGIVIASMDSGVDINHPDIQSKYRGGTNSWFDPYGQHATPADLLGHGTQTMGIMVGGDAGGSSIGVAPGAKWIAAKIFNDAGVATLSGIHLGFQWILDPDGDPLTDDAPDVVNNSWGINNVGVCDIEFLTDVQALKASNIAVVFSAGNSGPAAATSLSPANYAESFSVGAVNEFSTVDYSSSRGPSPCSGELFPDVVAPGVNVRTTDRTYGGVILNSYANVSGTSFAAPHVSAVIALLKSALPGASLPELESAIRSSAVDLFPTGPDTDSGHGLLNAKAAYFQLPIDTDGDGVYDGNDNCILVPNIDQYDSNSDGYGNKCDADLNNDGVVNLSDYSIFRLNFGTTDVDSDFNGDGVVNLSDYSVFRLLFSLPPGPSAFIP